jgi:hypothetical protein
VENKIQFADILKATVQSLDENLNQIKDALKLGQTHSQRVSYQLALQRIYEEDEVQSGVVPVNDLCLLAYK